MTPAPSRFAAFHDRRFAWIALALALLRVWFVSALPVIGLAGSEHDDQLFLQLGDSIARGEWLGDYSRFTLMKGCGYPLLIAAAFKLGVPLPLAEQGLYLLGCWLLVRALRPLLRHDAWSLALFALLVWQPMGFWVDPHGGNILRQNLYTPLTLLVFASLIALHTRRDAPPLIRLGWAALLGLSFAWLWLTREESIWIIPSLALLLVSVLSSWLRDRTRWRSLLAPLACASLTTAVPLLTVCTLNQKHYGLFGTVEFRAPAFVSAYAALGRVRSSSPLERVPLPRDARLLIYDVSPTFARLRPHLEGDLGIRWSSPELQFNGGMWVWALRESVQLVVNPRNAREALAFYQQLANEVNAACDAGLLPAAPRRDTFLPPWTPVHTAILRREGSAYFQHFIRFEGFNARPPRSHGDAEGLKLFRDLTRWHLAFAPDVPEIDTPRQRHARAWRIGALQDIGRVLRWPCVALVWLGAVAWISAALRSVVRHRAPHYLWWLATAALGGALAVFTISLLVHVTSWGDWRPLRFIQAYPLLLLFGFAAVAALFLSNTSDQPPPPANAPRP
jgi:hypothetical protein